MHLGPGWVGGCVSFDAAFSGKKASKKGGRRIFTNLPTRNFASSYSSISMCFQGDCRYVQTVLMSLFSTVRRMSCKPFDVF